MGINAHDLAATTPIDELRTMYREELALYRVMISSPDNFNSDECETQKVWLDAIVAAGQIKSVEIPATQTCYKCGGSGEYRWGGSVNGKPVHSGKCFRCDGTGTITAKKERGNRYYDNHVMRVYA